MKAEKQHKVLQAGLIQPKQERSKLGFVDNRPQAVSQTKLIQSIQKKEYKTGLPDNLKTGVENLSGFSMDDVRVHYNSDKPAQLQALAYTHGTDIHVGAGLEKHLPHEASHVVQHKQWRVQPTMQMRGVNVNDNKGLEKEADVMKGKAQRTITQFITNTTKKEGGCKPVIQLLEMQKYALVIDFFDKEDRRKNYFSTDNIRFCDEHDMDFDHDNFDHTNGESNNIDVESGKLKGKRKGSEKEETQAINFLANPLVGEIPLSEIVTYRNKLEAPVKKHKTGYSSLKYERDKDADTFTTDGKEKDIQYDEVMFVEKDSKIYFAPNSGDNIKLSHPSLLGGYSYNVDDAGTLEMREDKVTAINDSGHYGKYDDKVNVVMTDLLNPPKQEQQLNALEKEQHSSSSSKCCYITTSTVNYMGLDDDCEELTLLRKFRDGYLINQPNGEDLIKLYYRYAPQIVEGIDKRDNKAEIYINLYEIVKQCAIAIRNGDNEFAFNTYCRMVRKLYDEFIDETEDCVLETVI